LTAQQMNDVLDIFPDTLFPDDLDILNV
jgi:hypothetical protein